MTFREGSPEGKNTFSLNKMIAHYTVIRQASEALFRSIWIEFPAIIYVRQGSKLFEYGDISFEVAAGQAMTFSPNRTVNINNRPLSDEDYIADVFVFNASLILDFYQYMGRERINAEPFSHIDVNDELQKVFHSAKDSLQTGNLPDRIAEHRSKEILLWLMEAGVYFSVNKEETLYDKVRKLILSDLSHSWKAGEVAAQLAMSESSLRRHLSEAEHSFTDILTEARLGRALDLLLTTDLPITTIALDVGYSSPSSFTDRFKSRFTIAPTAIRKRADLVETR